MTAYCKAFNNQLCNFVKILSDRFPTNKELKLALTGVEHLREYNIKKSIELFVMYGYKYRQFIINRDEEGLMKLNVEKEIASIKNNEDVNHAIDHFRSKIDTKEYEGIDIMEYVLKHWSSLDADEKENLWKYLDVLITLADKYIAECLRTK